MHILCRFGRLSSKLLLSLYKQTKVMTKKFIGREEEIGILQEVLVSGESEFVALYGRRRVGKTFLIETIYKNEIVFSLTGLNQTGKELQLENFTRVINRLLDKLVQIPTTPMNWLKAFDILQLYLEQLNCHHKKVVFIDELPWLATSRSGFLPALENFWNAWASKRNDIVLVVCGSAASWMITNIVRNKGGLHNRITQRIRLLPFNLYETELFLKSRNIQLERYDILQLYMVMGGIPHYLKEVKKGYSATQIIDKVCFSKDGLLRDEFTSLYHGLFNMPERYIDVIKTLAKHPKGLNRTALIKAAKLSSGGTTTKILTGLEESGFIITYLPIGNHVKKSLFKLSDLYSAFYLKFIANSRASESGTWLKISATSSWKSWSGFAFERLCLAHTHQIKNALGISGIYTEQSAWRHYPSKETSGAQIDLVIDRADKVINLIEIKFADNTFLINKKYAEELKNKLQTFKVSTKTKKTLFLTMLTTYGLVDNQYSASLIQQSLGMNVLFKAKNIR